MSTSKRKASYWISLALLSSCASAGLVSCYSPLGSQEYFVEAAAEDEALEPIYSTALYTVYFDYALARCVVHSTHTWGQQGGGGGGTGIGLTAFRCDPNRIRYRARGLGFKTYPPRGRFKLPAPSATKKRGGSPPPQPSSRGVQ